MKLNFYNSQATKVRERNYSTRCLMIIAKLLKQ